MSTIKLTTSEFIKRCKCKFKNRYTYEKTSYVNKRTKIVITCRIHGDFTVLPLSFLKTANGCYKCALIKNIRTRGGTIGGTAKRPNKGSYRTFNNNCKKYDDTYLNLLKNLKTDYTYLDMRKPIINTEIHKIVISCNKHGVFKQTIKAHLSKQGCPQCGKRKASENKKIPYNKFLDKANTAHNNSFTYEKNSYASMSDKVNIICPYHGKFRQLAISHTRGTGCPKCGSVVQGSSPKSFKGIPTLFYVIKLINNTYKLGITTLGSIDKRYKKGKDKNAIRKIVFLYTFIDGFDARTFELLLIKKLRPFNYQGKSIMTIGTVEVFTINPTDIVQQLLIKENK